MTAEWIYRRVREQVRAHPWLVFAAVAAFCFFAVAAGGSKLGAQTAARWRTLVGQNVHVIAYLADDLDRDRALELADVLGHAATVARTTLVEPAEAFARLQTSALASGVAARALDSLEPAYFPRSIEILLVPEGNLADRAADLASRLREVPSVVQVDAMTSGLGRLSVWIDLGRKLGQGVLMALALVTAVVLIALLLGTRSSARQRSLVLTQLGETTYGIRIPSCVWMAAAALVGGLAGAILLGLGWRTLLGHLERNLGIVSTLPVPSLGFGDVAIGFVLVLLTGSVMGYFAAPLPRASHHG